MINADAYVVENIAYTPKCYRMRLAIPCTEPIQPGQFAHILCDDANDPLLRRPFSFYDVQYFDNALTNVDILFTVVGKGTKILSKKKPLDRVGFLGPLGRGFTCDKGLDAAIFVAGGVGIVPFYPLAKQFMKEHPRTHVILLFGARSKEDLYGVEDFEELGIEVHKATDDGSTGVRGFVTQLMEQQIQQFHRTPRKKFKLYACGPEPMLDRIVAAAQRDSIPCEVSMEKRMGCALGACGACATKVYTEDRSDFRYSRICIDGPTYDAREVCLT